MIRYIFILLISSLLVSCSGDEDSQTNVTLRLNISIYNQPKISKQAFQDGDKVGVYLVDYVDGAPGVLGNVFQTRYFNIEYGLSNGGWHAADGQEIYMSDSYSDLYSYYPYDPEMSRVDGKMDLTAYPFSIETEQSELSETNDFLWSKSSLLSASDSQANIIFRHLMSRFEINLDFNGEAEIPSDPQLKIYNTQTSCTINMRLGVVSPNGEANIVLPHRLPGSNEGFDFTYHAIIIPQVIPQGTPLFSVTTNEQTLIYETESELTILPQNIYTFNMTVPTAST